MNNIQQLYKEYALINNILLTAEGETDLSEYSVRDSISPNDFDKKIRKFRGPDAQRDWDRAFMTCNRRRQEVLSKTNVIRRVCQFWMDQARFREGLIKQDGSVKNRFQIFLLHIKYLFKGELKAHNHRLDTMAIMFASVVLRLDQLEGGVENQQESQARAEAKAEQAMAASTSHHIGFNNRY